MGLVLGIESSCDETAVALVTSERHILAQRIASQDAEHAPYGGVVPEIAARAHAERLAPMIEAVLEETGISLPELDAIAATAGPGLIGGVMVGLVSAKALAMASGVPLLAINHLEGHALTARLTHNIAFPYLLLLVSGGHTQLVAVHGVGRYERLGTTIDDAAGEAFDKTAKLLGLGYPGGPRVEQRAGNGDPSRFDLPRPLKGRKGADFSFAGLKTAVRLAAEAASPLTEKDVDDLAAGFQQAAVDCLADRTRNALVGSTVTRFTALVAAGGVAANRAVANALQRIAGENGLPLVLPPLALCGDNAAMIAWAAAERMSLAPSATGWSGDTGHPALARWPLDTLAPPQALA